MIGQAERLIRLKKLAGKKQNSSKKKNIITFTSGKGGTGKTFLSLSTAYTLSSLGKKVLFIDFDLNFANSNILLNTIPKVTLNDFFNGKKLFKEVITDYNSNLHFIFGKSGSEPFELNNEMISRFYDNLISIKDNYEFILIDTFSGGQKELITLISLSDVNVIVATPEPTAVMDAYVIIKLLSREDYVGNNLVAVNKSNDANEAVSAFNNIKSAAIHFLGEEIEFLGYVCNDEAVLQSIVKQELLVEKFPSFNVSKMINKLACSLSDIIHMANIHQAKSPVN